MEKQKPKPDSNVDTVSLGRYQGFNIDRIHYGMIGARNYYGFYIQPMQFLNGKKYLTIQISKRVGPGFAKLFRFIIDEETVKYFLNGKVEQDRPQEVTGSKVEYTGGNNGD